MEVTSASEKQLSDELKCRKKIGKCWDQILCLASNMASIERHKVDNPTGPDRPLYMDPISETLEVLYSLRWLYESCEDPIMRERLENNYKWIYLAFSIFQVEILRMVNLKTDGESTTEK